MNTHDIVEHLRALASAHHVDAVSVRASTDGDYYFAVHLGGAVSTGQTLELAVQRLDESARSSLEYARRDMVNYEKILARSEGGQG